MSAWGNDVYWREVSFSGNQNCHLGEHDVYWREVFVRWLIVLWSPAMYCGSSSDVMEIVPDFPHELCSFDQQRPICFFFGISGASISRLDFRLHGVGDCVMCSHGVCVYRRCYALRLVCSMSSHRLSRFSQRLVQLFFATSGSIFVAQRLINQSAEVGRNNESAEETEPAGVINPAVAKIQQLNNSAGVEKRIQQEERKKKSAAGKHESAVAKKRKFSSCAKLFSAVKPEFANRNVSKLSEVEIEKS
ncbi:hypothetical protein F511_04272 [Dorcoceras hygrometricum]|uniref:Uncharacterized protein n=1 Tax=Dorcoceras hygrometricum TaxID=472368 RepID=A0A2Z7C209_9LAMI|nr:hypothetical protein F511_04272 [Dorcoceras hygrometricum]